jgi:hypothetical protein
MKSKSCCAACAKKSKPKKATTVDLELARKAYKNKLKK